MGKKIVKFTTDNNLPDDFREFIHEPTFHVTETHWFAQSAAARYMGISVRKLVDLGNEGIIPCYDVLNRRTYKREDLDRFMQSTKWTKHPMKNQKPEE